MSEENNDKLIEGHEYDGIQELNNPLPKWWLSLFYITIVFGVGYYSYYELLGGPSHQEQLESSLAELKAKQESQVEVAPNSDEIDVQALLKDPAAMKVGKAAFVQTCAACHGQKGEGIIGPNLTDKYWISSKGDFAGVLDAIREGFPDKGMPPWKDAIPAEKHAPLTVYVLSLQGTNPPNGKAAQGDLIE